jgi:hypothetical protein
VTLSLAKRQEACMHAEGREERWLEEKAGRSETRCSGEGRKGGVMVEDGEGGTMLREEKSLA